jgi:hypothetical protein
MDFNFMKTIVSGFVFIFLLYVIANHIIKTWFSGHLTPRYETFETATSETPSATSEPIENSETIANLFDKVNTQIDMIRTLKEPYTDAVQEITYNRDVSGNMLILSNLKTLVNAGIAINDKDLQTNAGITKIFQYGGNDSLSEVIADLSEMNETKLAELCKNKNTSACEKISSTTDRASCISKIQKQCQKEIEASYLNRVSSIVEAHQRIIERILKKGAK